MFPFAPLQNLFFFTGSSASAKSSTLPLPHRLNVERSYVPKERERDGYYRSDNWFNLIKQIRFTLSIFSYLVIEMNWFEKEKENVNATEVIWVTTTRGNIAINFQVSFILGSSWFSSSVTRLHVALHALASRQELNGSVILTDGVQAAQPWALELTWYRRARVIDVLLGIHSHLWNKMDPSMTQDIKALEQIRSNNG